MSEYVYAGLTSQTIDVFLQDSSSSTGQGLAGLAYNSAGLVASYRKGATGSRTAITLATQTVGGAYSSGGFVEIEATHMKGVYRLDIPNAAVDTEGFVTLFLYGATNLLPTALRIDCRPIPADIKKLLGTAWLTPGTAGTPDVNVKLISGDSTAADNLEAAADGTGYNLGSGQIVAASVTGAVGSVSGAVGSVTGNVGGNVTGSTGSVVGAVGSVTGAVGSVTGNVGGNLNGNVVGSVASVTGNLGGNVSGNVSGSVGSVTGAVGSVTGSVGSVVGSVGGSVASVAGAVGSVTGNVGGDVSGKVLGGGSGTISGDGVRAASVTGAVGSVTGSVGSVVGAVVLDPAAPGQIADAVWDEAMSGHTTNGTYGARIVRSTNSNVEVQVTGSNHIAADVHEFQAGVITAGDFANNSLTAAALAADAVAEIQSGLSTLTAPQVNAEVVDALSVDTYAELTAPPAATSSLKDKLTWLFMYARNKVTQTATQRKLYRDDGTTVAGTSGTSDDGTTFTKGEDA